MDVGAAGATDKLVVNGALDLSSTNDVLNLVVPEGAVLAGRTTLVSFTGVRTGVFTTVRVNDGSDVARPEQIFSIGDEYARLDYGTLQNGSLDLVWMAPPATLVTIR
jgi:hypothetical protein